MMRTACTLAMVLLLLGTALPASGQVTRTAKKDVRFTWKPKDAAVPGFGSVTFGENFALDKNIGPPGVKAGPLSDLFALDPNNPSYPAATKATATHGGSTAKSTISVGKLGVLPAGDIFIDGTIELTTTVPNPGPPGKGGTATARGRINLNGVMTTTGLTVDGVKAAAAAIPGTIGNLKAAGLFLDPISMDITGQTYGERIQADIFDYRLQSSIGADAGLNADNRLELSAAPGLGGAAVFESRTLVSWATDYTGFARLDDGQFSVGGIFMPPSGNISDYWDLDRAGPDYIKRATLKPEYLPRFEITARPPVQTEDTFDVGLGASAYLSLDTVPEPESLVLLLLGVLARRGRPH